MKIAVVLHGNLRTFLMPLRNDPNLRICDIIRSNIVEYNDADVFVVTDVTDFYYNGVQFFNDAIDVRIPESFDVAFCENVDFMDSTSARALLENELTATFGDRLKAMEINDVIDVSSDPKFILLSASGGGGPNGFVKGCFPDRLVNQYIKIKRAGELLREYEQKNNVRYDIIFRGRIDNKYGDGPLSIGDFDHENFDVFVPSSCPYFVMDWVAFGNRKAMDLSLYLYYKLGYTSDDRLFRCECTSCKLVSCGKWTPCECGGKMLYEEMTLAPEYHLFKVFHDYGIRYSVTPIGSPYRYRENP